MRGERTDDAVDGLTGVQRVERREHEVARLRRVERDRHGLGVAHFADENHVRVLAERGAQRRGKARRVVADLPLADQAADVVVSELDRVLDRDDVVVPRAIDVVDHRRERGGLTRAGDARDQQEPAALHRELLEHLGQPELLELGLLRRDRSQHRADRPERQEHVDAEAAEVRHGVRRVDLAPIHQLAVHPLGETPVGDRVHVLGGDHAEVPLRHQTAVDPEDDRSVGLQVQVGGAALDAGDQELVEFHRHELLLFDRHRLAKSESVAELRFEVRERRRIV